MKQNFNINYDHEEMTSDDYVEAIEDMIATRKEQAELQAKENAEAKEMADRNARHFYKEFFGEEKEVEDEPHTYQEAMTFYSKLSKKLNNLKH